MFRLTLPEKTLVASMGLAVAAVLVVTTAAAAGAPVWLLIAIGGAFLAAALWLGLHERQKLAKAVEVISDRLGHIERGETAALPRWDEIGEPYAAVAEMLTRNVNEARESRDRYEALAEGLPALVWIAAHEGAPLYQNRRVSHYVGDATVPLLNAERGFIHPDDLPRVTEAWREAYSSVQDCQIEARLRRADGAYRWHIMTTVPLGATTEDDRAHWLTTALDIENLKEAEELQARLNQVLERKIAEATQQLRDEISVRQKAERQLRQTQKMEAISRLTGGIAHDLNNKLMIISANIDAVTKHIKEQPQLRRKLLAALVAADQAAALMSKLLAFARQRDLQVQYIDVAERLDSITSLLDRSFLSDSVEVRLSIPEDLWPIEVDPHELETAIVNLAVNARDAMRRGGAISIEARNINVQKGFLADPDLFGEFVQIVIADTGEGILPQHLEHVFEPFFTTKEASRASGLGLSQVHGFVQQLGGTAEVSSTVGVGTSVALYLPRAEVPVRLGSKPDLDDLTDDEEEESSAAEILIVDDEVEVALALQSMLEESGYLARTAIGPDEALAAIRTRRPNLLLTDVTMPGTRDGVALAREVRQIDPSLPVVLITGNPMVVAESSEFPLLQKPIVSRELRAAIQRLLAVPPDASRVVSLFPRRRS